MTTTTSTTSPTSTASHPLDRLTGEEIELSRAIIVDAGHVSEQTLFALVSLVEPEKRDVIAGATHLDRRVRSLLVERGSGEQTEVLVSLTDRKVLLARVLDVATEGQAPITMTEYESAEQMIRNDTTFRAAVEARGITDMETVRICALSAGRFDIPGEKGRRLVRGSSFIQSDPQDNAWAHPLEGLVAYLDLNTGEVIDVIDTDIVPVPKERFDYHLDSWLPEPRTTQKPIEISQPEGVSFSLDGDVLTWEKWQVRLGFDPVEGLVLHQIGFDDNGEHRPIVYRASVAEMVVPYGDPSPVRFWQNYFDAGEYSMGKSANSLELGCDCLGEIQYSDAVLADEQGHAHTIKNAICIHEEDAGILFKHTDEFTGAADVRRNRRIVISFFITVGNYDYGFYWYLYLDGTIELECKATGIVYTAAYGDEPQRQRWSSPLGDEGLGMPFHQHMFCARLDMQVDGIENAVDEQEVVRVPFGDDNPYGNAFTRKQTRLTEEGGRLANGEVGRVWHVINPEKQNRHGFPVGYQLHMPDEPTMMAAEGSSISKRAGFGSRHVWLTQFDENERFPSGTYPNQNPGQGTITQWVEQQRPVDGDDIVLWPSFAMTHFPRPEDWPIMPVDRLGFSMKPYGFFDQNPALDVPRPKSGHCTSEGGSSCECG
ncbi:primary-amine oxidase [Brevibacterium sp. UCMA 11754]|uniref:primary-amine oxidase n=1 Tax=Brevibacterium sp. UCMA 11754 TaxID=2749198 RepID=UPI001F1DF30F|nr:primary-amine oxidase [Brevibacterium sp. UCMA 11754]MCF2573639.1 primary-amine oxidase [Brevibacterium sp. UCMA 11754]